MNTPETQDSVTLPSDIERELEDIDNAENILNMMEDAENEENREDTSSVGDNAENQFSNKKRKKTSTVWDEFKEVTLSDGSKKVECIHYNRRLGCSKTGTTTQYRRHLQVCLKRKIASSTSSVQQRLGFKKLLNNTRSSNEITTFRYDHAYVREGIAAMIMIHDLPFNYVENEMFNEVMRRATPYFESISRTTVRKDCFALYEIEKKKIKQLLQSVDRISLTTDLWKSGQNLSYMVVTGHYVDEDWNLQKRVLSFCDVPPPHTGIIISDILHKCISDWGIDKKVCTVSVDNAAYNDIAVRTLKDALSYQNMLPLNGKLFHVRCCAHILNILVQDGLKEISGITNNIRLSVEYVIASESRIKIFSELAKQLKLPTKKLIMDCPTRWNSTYFMLSAALEFKDVFPRFAQMDTNYTHLPSEDDWQKVKKVCIFLEEFNVVTNLISGSEYPTSNLFFPELYKVKQLLDKKATDSDAFMKDMAEMMKFKFDKYWGDCNLVISIAAVLDPRYKMKIINWCFPKLYSPADSVENVATVTTTLKMLYDEYVANYKSSCHTNSSNTSNTTHASNVNPDGCVKRKVTGTEELLAIIRQHEPNIESQKSELEIYLEEGIYIPKGVEFDVLQWWNSNSLKFQILSKMARDILSIPITTVASESAFSAGSRVIDPYRASLSTETVQVLICGADWLRASYGIKRKKKDINEVGKEMILH